MASDVPSVGGWSQDHGTKPPRAGGPVVGSAGARRLPFVGGGETGGVGAERRRAVRRSETGGDAHPAPHLSRGIVNRQLTVSELVTKVTHQMGKD